MESTCPDESLRMRRTNLNLHFAHARRHIIFISSYIIMVRPILSVMWQKCTYTVWHQLRLRIAQSNQSFGYPPKRVKRPWAISCPLSVQQRQITLVWVYTRCIHVHQKVPFNTKESVLMFHVNQADDWDEMSRIISSENRMQSAQNFAWRFIGRNNIHAEWHTA